MTTIVGFTRILAKDTSFIECYMVYDENTQAVVPLYLHSALGTPLINKDGYTVDFQKVKCGFGGAYVVPYLRYNNIPIEDYKSSFQSNLCIDYKIDTDISNPDELRLAGTLPSNRRLHEELECLTDISAYLLQNGQNTINIDKETIDLSKVLVRSELTNKLIDYYKAPTKPIPYKTPQQTPQQPTTQQQQPTPQQSQPTQQSSNPQPQPTQQPQSQPKPQPTQQPEPTQQQQPIQSSNLQSQQPIQSTPTNETTTLTDKYKEQKPVPDVSLNSIIFEPSSIAKRDFKPKKVDIPNISIKEVL